MAERCAVAFGRYLKTLRDRKGLSLDDVASLSRTFADPITKSYLSRCENGHLGLALPKMIPLSRIYEVPTEVLVERLELDMELDKVGGPETAGLSYAELTQKGKAAFDHGALWDAYGCFRDSVLVAHDSELMGRIRDHREQLLCAFMNVSSAALKLGRPRVALYELEYIRDAGGLSERIVPILLERISHTYLSMNQLDKAREHADLAIANGEGIHLLEFLGYLYSTRALIADHERDSEHAVQLHQRAFQAFRDAGHEPECSMTLNNLAQTYFDLKRYRSSRRALAASERMAVRLQQERTRALVRIKLGEIEELEQKPQEAAAHWREAASIANALNDKVLRFQAEFLLYRQALSKGDALRARVIERRLQRLSPWICGHLEELEAFRKLLSASNMPRRRRVAVSQRRQLSACNPGGPTSLM